MHLPSIFNLISILSWTTLIVRAHPSDTSDQLRRRATVCNGHAELCDRGFGNVTFIGAHNSYSFGLTSNAAANQDQPISRQLDDGIRMLQMQAHNDSGTIKLCHTSCVLLDGGSLLDFLKTVKQWLDKNPNEVLSLLIVNSDNVPVSNYGTVFASAGLDTMSYVPTTLPLPASGWPTLGSLIDSGKRLLTFMDNGADTTAVPYIIDEFTNIWETAFGVTGSFDCNVDRPKGKDTTNEMFLINHFLDVSLGDIGTVPNVASLNETNAATGDNSVGSQVTTCQTLYGRNPNFILVDFYEFGGGSVFQVAADLNGVSRPTSAVATPSPTGASSSPSVTSRPLSGATKSSITQLPLFFFILSGLNIAGLFMI